MRERNSRPLTPPPTVGASGHRREKRSPSLRAVPVLHNARCSSAPPNTSASPSMSLHEEQLAPGLGGKVSKRPSEAYLSTLFSWVPSTTVIDYARALLNRVRKRQVNSLLGAPGGSSAAWMRAMDDGLGIGYLIAFFVLMVGPEERVVGFEQILKLVASSIESIKKSAAAPQLNDGSVTTY